MTKYFTRKEKLQIRLRDRRRYRKTHLCFFGVFGVLTLTDTELHHLDGVTQRYKPDRIMELCHNCHELLHEVME